MTEEPDTRAEDFEIWDDVERRAMDEHMAQCVRGKWRHLTPEQRAVTTFHGVNFHYRNHKGKDGISYG